MTLLELQDVLGKAIVSIEDGTGNIDKAKAIASLAKQMIWCRSNGYFVLSAKKFYAGLNMHPEWSDGCVKRDGYPFYRNLRLKSE